MKNRNRYLFILLYIFLFSLLTGQLFAQGGFSSASLAYQKSQSVLPAAQDIVVEEYMNYHRHSLPIPQDPQSIHLDLQWGAEQWMNPSQMLPLQIGLSTARAKNAQQVPPLNLSLIIDKSGSMAQEAKMQKVKDALRAFIQQLRPIDRVSIIAFDDEASLLLASTEGLNQAQLLEAIEKLKTGGGTNLQSGLILGYKELSRHYDPKKANCAFVLTDGHANVGEINPERITKNPSEQEIIAKIQLSAIGIGNEYNNGLLRQLVASGGGQIHFIADDADIQKVFVEDVWGMMGPIAQEVKLEIEYDEALELQNFYGYQKQLSPGKITLYLKDINLDLTQIIISNFRLKYIPPSKRVEVKTRLTYRSFYSQEWIHEEKSSRLKIKKPPLASPETESRWGNVENKEILKNLAIAEMAQSLKESAALYHTQERKKALETLNTSLYTVNQVLAGEPDVDILRIQSILKRHRDYLEKKDSPSKEH